MARPIRIVLVEDNPADVYWLHMTLREMGRPYDLKVFTTGESALAHTKEWGRPDALLFDWFLPMMNADGFLEIAKSNWKLARLPIAVFTCIPEYELKALSLGAIFCLRKPVDAAQIERLFSRLPMRKRAQATLRGPRRETALRIRLDEDARLLLQIVALRNRAERVVTENRKIREALAASLRAAHLIQRRPA